MATLGGRLRLFDLRYLQPTRTWRLASDAAILALAAPKSRALVFAAIAGDANEVRWIWKE